MSTIKTVTLGTTPEPTLRLHPRDTTEVKTVDSCFSYLKCSQAVLSVSLGDSEGWSLMNLLSLH